MSIDLTGLSAKQLGTLIQQARKQQAVVAKRVPVAKVRAKLKPVFDKYSANVGVDFYKQVMAEFDKLHGKK